ncbi:hypothetical protein DMN91_005686 [Ooceraea biroi]|uniref:Uncharacterized protein n=1 Tax=Ooceraea biroi TaxID=2015173 RepID=A0A3L8DM69_OOCBI|nr:hypothetical protein DMN91_005686 [Ooceraea biroi]
MSTIALRDNANEDAIVHEPIVDCNITLDPIVIDETTTIVITKTQKFDRRHQHVKAFAKLAFIRIKNFLLGQMPFYHGIIRAHSSFLARTPRGVSHDAPSRYIEFSEPDLTLATSMLMRDHANAPWGPTSARAIGRSLPQAVLPTARKGHIRERKVANALVLSLEHAINRP